MEARSGARPHQEECWLGGRALPPSVGWIGGVGTFPQWRHGRAPWSWELSLGPGHLASRGGGPGVRGVTGLLPWQRGAVPEQLLRALAPQRGWHARCAIAYTGNAALGGRRATQLGTAVLSGHRGCACLCSRLNCTIQHATWPGAGCRSGTGSVWGAPVCQTLPGPCHRLGHCLCTPRYRLRAGSRHPLGFSCASGPRHSSGMLCNLPCGARSAPHGAAWLLFPARSPHHASWFLSILLNSISVSKVLGFKLHFYRFCKLHPLHLHQFVSLYEYSMHSLW